MRTRVILLLFVAAIATNLPSMVTAEQGQTTALAGDPRFGVVEAYVAPDRASEAGVRWERVIFWWYDLQPNGPDDWNEAFFPDRIVAAERAAGREIVGLLMNPPKWANGTGIPTDPPRNLYLPFDDPNNVWGQFVQRIVSRYRGRIDRWIIGNEPDVWDAANPGFTWNGSVEDYYQFLKVAYLAAKRANALATVVAAGLTYWWDQEYGRPQYFQRLLDVAQNDPTAPANNWYFDAAAIQLYNDPKALYDIPQLFRKLMADRGVAEKPIWITETNVPPWNDPAGSLTRDRFRATLEEQSSYLIQAFAYALAANVDRISIYKMADSPALPPGAERYGLVRGDGTARPAYQAFQVAARHLAGVHGGRVIREGPVIRVVLDRGDQSVAVLWNTTPRPVTASVRAAVPTATLVSQRGDMRVLRANEGRFLVVLQPATANTVPGSPNEYRIGGPPLLLLQPKGTGDDEVAQQTVSDDAWFDDETGYAVSSAWWDAYRALGGLDNLGHPVSDVVADPSMGGQTVQYFQRAILEYHPENPAPFRIQRRLLGDLLYPGADPVVSVSDAPPGAAQFFPLSQAQPTGLGHFVADFTRTGQPTYFKQFFDSHGGVDAFGYPKEEPKLRNGLWTQRFQAAVFEYHPENDRAGVIPGTSVPYRSFRVQLALLGDAYAAQYGRP